MNNPEYDILAGTGIINEPPRNLWTDELKVANPHMPGVVHDTWDDAKADAAEQTCTTAGLDKIARDLISDARQTSKPRFVVNGGVLGSNPAIGAIDPNGPMPDPSKFKLKEFTVIRCDHGGAIVMLPFGKPLAAFSRLAEAMDWLEEHT